MNWLQKFFRGVDAVVCETGLTTGSGTCPETGKQHVKSPHGALIGLAPENGTEVLHLWLCPDCQGLFYTREPEPENQGNKT